MIDFCYGPDRSRLRIARFGVKDRRPLEYIRLGIDPVSFVSLKDALGVI